jgi:hypothetical protein
VQLQLLQIELLQFAIANSSPVIFTCASTTTLYEGSAIADRGDPCAGDQRSDPRRSYWAPAVLVVLGKRFDLRRNVFNPSIELAPIIDEVLEQPQRSGESSPVCCAKMQGSAWQPGWSLSYCNAMPKKETADPVDHCRALTD